MTEDKATLVPQIRFRGFTDAWVQRKLGEGAEFSYGGGTPSTVNDEFWNGDIPWLQSSDLTEHNVTQVNLRKYITQKGLKCSAAKLVPAKSIAIVTRVGVGKLCIVPFQYTTSQDFLSLSKLNVDIWFGVYVIYKKLQGELYSVQGTSIKGITKEELLNKTINVPSSIPEQTSIGNFIRALDDTITLYKRKLDGLKELKKGYLQQMFPQAGENEPRVRFAGFTKPWEQRKLGENAKVTMGQSPDSINYTNNPNDHILVQGNADMKNGKVVPRVYTTQITKTAQKGEIILSIRAPVGDVGKTDYNIVLGRGVAAINGNEFIYQTLIRIKEFGYWKKIIQGSTFESINSNDLREIVVFVPYPSEQITIGKFFRNFDEQITMHQAKLDKLKKLKESYLQKMFI